MRIGEAAAAALAEFAPRSSRSRESSIDRGSKSIETSNLGKARVRARRRIAVQRRT